MANDTAMTKQESEVMIEQLKKIFEVVRLLDGDALETGNLKDLANADGFPCKCYDFWKKGTRCKNCTSKEALQKKEKLLKLEYLSGNFQICRNRWQAVCDGTDQCHEVRCDHG